MNEKICTKCKKHLCITLFHRKGKGLSSTCKDCRAKYHRDYYLKNKKSYNDRIKLTKSKNNYFVKVYKTLLGCYVCQERSHVVLDFHHLDSKQKEHNISRMTRDSKNINDIKSEIKKCIVLCSNCHRKLHAGVINL
jgi:hypothetical protein